MVGGAPTDAAPADFTVSTTQLSFGDVVFYEASASQNVVVTNTSAVAQDPMVTIDASSQVGRLNGCEGVTLDPGGACTVELWLFPIPLGPFAETATIGVQGAPHTVELIANVLPAFAIAPASIDLGEVPLMTAVDLEATVTGIGTTGHFFRDDSDVGNECTGTTLEPGDSCTFSFQFLTDALGPVSATYQLDASGVDDDTITVQATSVFPVTVSPTTDIGSVEIGSSAVGSVVVTNIGAPMLAPDFSVDALAAGSPFALVADTCTGATLASMATCRLDYGFTPVVAGSASDTTEMTVALTGEVSADQTFPIVLTGSGVDPGDSTTSTTTNPADTETTTTVPATDPTPTLPATC